MQRLKNYRERLGYSHATANEREGAERRGGETKEQRDDSCSKWERCSMNDVVQRLRNRERTGCWVQQISLHSTAAQSVHHAFPNAPPRLNAYLWLPTLLSQARPTNVLHFTSYILRLAARASRAHFLLSYGLPLRFVNPSYVPVNYPYIPKPYIPTWRS